jgi:hypothetical protein
MLRSCVYKCSPLLASSWPNLLASFGYTVSELKRVFENHTEAYSGIVSDGDAKISISPGLGGPVALGPYSSDVYHLLLMFKTPLVFNRLGRNLKLALQVEQILLNAGAELFAPDLRLKDDSAQSE